MRYLTLIFLLTLITCYSQQNTEVFLFDLSIEKDFVMISNSVNISNNPGYDSQPSFLDNNRIVFSSTNKGQTDIALYNIKKGTKNWVQETESSEFSPIRIKNKEAISLIKQGLDNSQKLYHYNLKDSTKIALVDNLMVGYHTWIDEENVALAILEDNALSLNIANVSTKTNETVIKNIGRSIHKIPNSELVSFIDKSEEIWKIKSFNPSSNEIKFIVDVIENSEDVCWTSNGILITGVGNKIYKYNPKEDTTWIKIGTLANKDLKNITRISINDDISKVAIVVEIE